MQDQFEITIVYGVNKPLEVHSSETIQDVKRAAMAEFAIPTSEENQFVLRAKQQGREQQLQENQTVQQAGLHPEEKVTLASGTPFGSS
jgi:Ras association (RalGDS/AF-6) domain-containing protein